MQATTEKTYKFKQQLPLSKEYSLRPEKVVQGVVHLQFCKKVLRILNLVLISPLFFFLLPPSSARTVVAPATVGTRRDQRATTANLRHPCPPVPPARRRVAPPAGHLLLRGDHLDGRRRPP